VKEAKELITCLVELDSLCGCHNGHIHVDSRMITRALFSYWINNVMSLVVSDGNLYFITVVVNR
jgi:hypothetical protein